MHEDEELQFREKMRRWADGSSCWYHPDVWPIFETMKHKILDKHHNVVTISGRVGTGKSEFAFQMGKYLNPNFSLEDVYWNTEDLIKAALNNDNPKPKGTIFIFDEAREGTQSLNAMSETNRKMGLFLDTVRSRGYHIILIQPSPWLFQRTIFIYASDVHFHIEKKGNDSFMNALKRADYNNTDPDLIKEKPFERGYLRIYDADQKLKLYVKGKELEDFNVAPSNSATFRRSHGIIDWDEYDTRKNKAVAAMNDAFNKENEPKISTKQVKLDKFKEKAFHILLHRYGMRVGEISEYFEIEQSDVSRCIKNYMNFLEKAKY